MVENVVVVSVAGPEEAHAVLGSLRRLDEAGTVELRAGAVVNRDLGGKLSLAHETGDALSFSNRHPRLGAVIALLLSPIDSLVFGNQLIALYGATEQSTEELAVGHLARAVPAGGTAVVADLVESDPAAVDAELTGATVTRRLLSDVEREIAATREGRT